MMLLVVLLKLLTRLVAAIPTVGDAIEALTDFCDELLETLKQMSVISAELEARDYVQVEDIRQVGHSKLPRSYSSSIAGSGYRLSACRTSIVLVISTSDKNAP